MKTLKNILLTLTVMASCLGAFAQGEGSMKTVSTLTELTLVQPDPKYPHCFVSGWTASNDGGWGIYVWTASSALTTNYSIVASQLAAGTGGQWIRCPGGGNTSPQTQTLAAATAIKAEAAGVFVVGTGGATTLTGTPTIAANGLLPGQTLTIVGTSDSNTVILQDESGLPGSKLELGASTRTLGLGDIIVLRYNGALGKWYEVSFTNN